MQHLMIHNEKLLTEMVKQPLGGNGGAGQGDGGRISKVLSRSKWKVDDKHPYNGKILKFKHCRKIDIHANDECFDLKSNTHRCLMY